VLVAIGDMRRALCYYENYQLQVLYIADLEERDTAHVKIQEKFRLLVAAKEKRINFLDNLTLLLGGAATGLAIALLVSLTL